MVTNNTNNLDELFKPHQKEFDVLQEALREVSEEQAQNRKTKAKEMLRKALDLKQQMDEAERQFNTQKQKWDKELGNILKRLTNMANNKPLDQEPEESQEQQS